MFNEIHEIAGNILQLAQAVGQLVPHVSAGGAAEPKTTIQVWPLIRGTIIFLAAISAVTGLALAFAAKKFFVKSDPLVEEINDALAHAHCGACGYAGCEQYAEAVAKDPNVPPNLCTPGGALCTELIARLTNKIPLAKDPLYARIMCQGGTNNSQRKFTYLGMKDCRGAVFAGGGNKACSAGCLGYGTCVRVCPFGALSMGDNGLPIVDIKKCTGCKKCEAACPKRVIEVLPASAKVLVACHSKDKGAITRRNCSSGCIACGKCVKVCPVNAPAVENNLSRIDQAKCIACGLCVINCPTKAIVDWVPARGKAFIKNNCIGCTLCAKSCPVACITGELKKLHVVDQAKCIGCGICTAKCPVQAIVGTFNTDEVLMKAEEKKKKRAQAAATAVQASPAA